MARLLRTSEGLLQKDEEGGGGSVKLDGAAGEVDADGRSKEEPSLVGGQGKERGVVNKSEHQKERKTGEQGMGNGVDVEAGHRGERRS